jgi:KDO2-lipid IV(A) lauroyltransferase
MVLMDKFGAAQRMPDILEAGGDIGFIADQNAGARGLFVPFFDRLASAYKAIGVMAVRYNATVVCGQAIRTSGRPEQSEGDGADRSDGDANDRHAPRRFTAHAGEPKARFSYDIRLNDIITPDDWADQPDPVFYITARYRRAIEDMVRAAPEQYLWMHRYWKSRPKFERDRKPFPPRLRQKIESLPWMTPERVERIVERSAVDAAAFIEQREAKRKRRAKAAAQASPA